MLSGHLRSRDYQLYVVARTLAILAIGTVNLSVAWTLYELTGDPLDLGLAGLVTFLPFLLLVFVTGFVADRFPRKAVAAACFVTFCLASLFMAVAMLTETLTSLTIFATLAVLGSGRAFLHPAVRALLVELVPRDRLPRAIAFNSTLTKVGTVSGPLVGGVLYALDAALTLVVASTLFAVSALMILAVRCASKKSSSPKVTPSAVAAGVRFIAGDRLLLGALSLDLFAVLVGGATALLPVYAKDMLGTDSIGLGILRASPAVGAVLVAALLAWRPISQRMGRVMLASVAAYGMSILVFGTSRVFWLSTLALFVAGAFDMVSVTLRECLIQLRTPDDMRGRVGAINTVFVGASNELGNFRAGGMAALIGAVPAVLVGGLGAMIIAAAWSALFPQLRRLDRIT